MEILVTDKEVSMGQIQALAEAWHGNAVKGVADCKRGVLALGGEWHMDANEKLLANGSIQEDVWGFNIYPNEKGSDAIAYTSLINIRPLQDNTEIELKDENMRSCIKELVEKLIPELKL